MSKRTGMLLMGAVVFLTGALVGQQLPSLRAQSVAGTIKEPRWSHAFNLKVRAASEKDFTKDTKKIAVEVFRDENTGNLVYLTETGSIAVIPAR